ncbi:phosphoglycerate kinase [Nostoc sp. NIES-2111]
MKLLQDFSFAGKKALVRVDFNVPLDKATLAVTDDTRLRAAIPTIKKILADGGSAILMSHLGRPKGGPEDKYSLRHIIPALQNLLGVEVQFADDCIGAQATEKAAALQPGQVLLLENLRFYKEEEAGDEGFAQKLAALGNVWVMDAFGTAHRAHASTAVMGRFLADRVCGLVMQAELDNARKVLDGAQRPYVAIMGGAKISDKILIIERLLDKVDTLIIGGGMAYTFFKAQGGEIGKSLLEADRLELARELMEKAKAKGVHLMLPADSNAAPEFNNAAPSQIVDNMAIPADLMGLDIGPKAIESFVGAIKGAKTVLWNGPMGVFEFENFAQGTNAVADAVVAATEAGGYSLIGGGDSAAAVNQLGYGDRVSYVSTGGGALLEYMEGKELPGVKALEA